jgi:L-ascorbate metabolism protein UlaG (beta-lactamase superfamily)
MKTLVFFIFILFTSATLRGQADLNHDVIKTSRGDLKMYFVNHGTLMFDFNELIVHVDPVSRAADYSNLPRADIILITHHHGDHLDKEAIKKISKPGTKLVLPQAAYDQLNSGNGSGMGEVMRNGEVKTIEGIRVEAVPAYNLVHTRDNGEPYHPKGVGNGYVIGFANKRVYVGGDTENFPEMKALKNISVAFLPMNLPYTMTPEMVADAVKKFNPEIVYPYHYGETDTQKLVDLLKDTPGTEVRIRDFY